MVAMIESHSKNSGTILYIVKNGQMEKQRWSKAAKILFKTEMKTTYHGLLTLCTKSEKTKDPILRKLSDRLMDPQREGMRRMFT